MSGRYKRKDHLYNQAKTDGYRSRAAYKLIELNKRFRLMKKGSKVLDLGCWPGGWLQVAANIIGEKGSAIGIDLVAINPINASELEEGAASPQFLKGDITDPEISVKLLSLCGPGLDVVLSDMSPKLSGIRDRDIAKSLELVEMAFSFATKVLRPGGHFVAKTFQSEEAQAFAKELKAKFKKLQVVNAESSRKTSTEIYLVGVSYVGTNRED